MNDASCSFVEWNSDMTWSILGAKMEDASGLVGVSNVGCKGMVAMLLRDECDG
jgi:hypothetical protein